MNGQGALKGQVWRMSLGQTPRLVEDMLADERPWAIVLGGEEATRLMVSPGEDMAALAAGYGLTMGWLALEGPLPAVVVDAPGRRVLVAGPLLPRPEQGPRGAGGGPTGPAAAKPLADDLRLELATALGLIEAMARGQALFAQTGASHGAAIFDACGAPLAVAEDVGRHNALDKAVGAAWLAGALGRARIAALSGRVSLEMALKAGRVGLQMVVSVSAPTAAAVEAARAMGLTVIGFARGSRLNVYSHPQRLVVDGRPFHA